MRVGTHSGLLLWDITALGVGYCENRLPSGLKRDER